MAQADFTKALDATDEIELTTIGRTSGRNISHPIWFVRDGTTLYLLPVKGSDSDWYKNVLKHRAITLGAKAATIDVNARPITDPRTVREVVDKFRTKYGAGEVKKYYTKLDVAVEAPLQAPTA